MILFLYFLAISDGILQNDALKPNGAETLNETWTNLLEDLKFFGDEEEHIMYLRRRFVLGASEFMSGANGSKQNDKELFKYTDDEWEFIWTTMLKDGAWAVPSIKDIEGNTVKANWAPEILIKFIAHQLRLHIIVFDLLLNRVQFLSGNHVKDGNVIFDSPLLIYTTGGHFQSVLPTDHEYFINYARELEAENNRTEEPKEVSSTSEYSEVEGKKSNDEEPTNISKIKHKSLTDPKKKTEEADKAVQPPIKKSKSILDIEEEIETLKKIKAKERTPEEKKLLEKLRKSIQRVNETKDQRESRQKKDQEQKKVVRDIETAEERKERQRKDHARGNHL